MNYSVQALAKIAGVSVRTLHHYDEIGLLTPQREKNGYRSYGEPELLRLQQILFFRELEYPLEEIQKILAQPGFDMQKSLKEHRFQIECKQIRLGGLLETIDKTLAKLAGEKTVTDDELFEAFWQKHVDEYAGEAEDCWGDTDAWKQSKERNRHFTEDDYKRIARESDAFMKLLAAAIDSGPTSEKSQELIAKHYESLRTFYDPSPALYRGLGQMYVDDHRFRKYFEKYDPRMPEFMRDAMHAYCDTLVGK